MKNHHPLPMITILVTAILSLQPVMTINSTPPTRINVIGCAEMEQAGPRSEKDEKQIRQVKSGILVPFHKEQHAFPVGHNYEQILACQRGHTFYFCNADSIWLRQLGSTATGFGGILINQGGPGTFVENPQAWLGDISLSADVYCCRSPVLPRDCSRGFELVYGDKTNPIPVTVTVSETSPSTDATNDTPTDMTTMLKSSPASMASPQTDGIPAQQFNRSWIVGVVTAGVSELLSSINTTTNAPTDMTTMLTSSPASMTSTQTGGIPAQQSNYVLIAGLVFADVVLVVFGFVLWWKYCRPCNCRWGGVYEPADQNETPVCP